LGRTIESFGLKVRSAQEGREALFVTSEARPDLILLDLNMPGMNGFDFLDELNKRPSPPPVIVITAQDLSQQERDRLVGRVSHLMERRTQSQEALLESINRHLVRYCTTCPGD
jgi:CheY-like chemotaxis protein